MLVIRGRRPRGHKGREGERSGYSLSRADPARVAGKIVQKYARDTPGATLVRAARALSREKVPSSSRSTLSISRPDRRVHRREGRMPSTRSARRRNVLTFGTTLIVETSPLAANRRARSFQHRMIPRERVGCARGNSPPPARLHAVVRSERRPSSPGIEAWCHEKSRFPPRLRNRHRRIGSIGEPRHAAPRRVALSAARRIASRRIRHAPAVDFVHAGPRPFRSPVDRFSAGSTTPALSLCRSPRAARGAKKIRGAHFWPSRTLDGVGHAGHILSARTH